MAGVLAIDPSYDLTTQYGEAFRWRLVFNNFQAQYPGHLLLDLKQIQACRKDIHNVVSNGSVDYISAMGHGDYELFTGHNGSIIWDTLSGLSNLNGKIVHLLSCKAGAVLGREMVKNGAKAFWGYTTDFGFVHQSSPPNYLYNDKTAEIFFHMDLIIDRGILAGKDSHAIYSSIEMYFGNVYPKLKTTLSKAVLLGNYMHLVCPATTWGDPKAVL